MYLILGTLSLLLAEAPKLNSEACDRSSYIDSEVDKIFFFFSAGGQAERIFIIIVSFHPGTRNGCLRG